MKTVIAVPCMEQVAAKFASSLAMLQKVDDCKVAFEVGSLVYNSRNDLARLAVQAQADYVLWLDSDMTFEPNLLQRLMEHMKDKDMVAGLYFRRSLPYTPVLFKRLVINHDGLVESVGYEDYPQKVFEVAGCGFGGVLMKTEILFDVVGKFGTWFTPIGMVGEDLAFCWRARECGYKIFCDPQIQLGHVGHVVVNEDFYKSYYNGVSRSGG